MTKIYKDAKDVPVVATIIYCDGATDTAFIDEHCSTSMSTKELKEAFVKGAMIYDTDHSVYSKPVAYAEDNGVGYVTYIYPSSTELVHRYLTAVDGE